MPDRRSIAARHNSQPPKVGTAQISSIASAIDRAGTAEELAEQFRAALAEPGPHLIDAALPSWSPG
ncbi:hypothetical protein [Mycolicibacterium porcinum]|uniref:hypothetical protein n=1 Tax=Mycolicibacterium porcinum TaxID=39693 RepID=UPI000ABE905A|nr:hypothetical protein [Mycolicibacterium porcinum]